jgi:uncharacterized protein YaiL (DUF2058 family)
MGGIKDQLLKAGLVSKKDVRKAGAEKRAERLAEGKRPSDEAEQAEKRRRELYERKLEEQKERDRERDEQRQQEQASKDLRNRAANLVAAHTVRFRGGDRRWYFVCRDGVIRNMGVPDDIARRLEGGQAGIVEEPRPSGGAGSYLVVEPEAVRAVREVDPPRILFWNGG